MNTPEVNSAARFSSHSSGLSSLAWTRPGADAPDPVAPVSATGTAGAVPPPAPATSSRESACALVATAAVREAPSCIRTEDGTVILFDRLTGRSVSGATREAAEAAMQSLAAAVSAPLVAGRQPHSAAMRFIDCLFGRCRAPLDLTLEEDPENDAPGSRPGMDMLCCGLPALKSYCPYHQARYRRPVAEAT